jgi:hypothetical protein
VVIYTYIFILLRRRIKQVLPVSRSASSNKISRAARLMVVYPIAYVALSLPLPAGRLAVWSGDSVSLTFYCIGATLMTSCGLADTILYTITRRVLIREIGDTEPVPTFSTADRSKATTTVVVGEDGFVMNLGKRRGNGQGSKGSDPSDSTEDIWRIVKRESFEVRHDDVGDQEQVRVSASSENEGYR